MLVWMDMAQLSTTILFVLFGLVVNEQVFRPSTNNRSVILFGNFFPRRGHKLSAAKLKNERVKSSTDCLVRCIHTNGCLSVNVNTTIDEQDLYVCELLASDKYHKESSFVPSKGIDHYSIASQCEKNPCQHGAKCVPLYPNHAYICEPGCDQGWIKFGNNCYFFNHDSSGQVDWHGAFRACQLLGGHLIDIRNEDEWHFVKANIQKTASLRNQYIIGITDAVVEGQWRYSDGRAVTFFKWKKGEPNGRTGENCGTIFSTRYFGYYNDKSCTYKFARYICKKGATQTVL